MDLPVLDVGLLPISIIPDVSKCGVGGPGLGAFCHTALEMLPASRPVGRGQGTALEPSQGMASPLNSRFLGQIVTFVGAGEVRSGVGTLASPMGGRGEAAGEQEAGRPKGPHPSSWPPPPLRDEPARTRRIRFLARFTKYLPLRGWHPLHPCFHMEIVRLVGAMKRKLLRSAKYIDTTAAWPPEWL